MTFAFNFNEAKILNKHCSGVSICIDFALVLYLENLGHYREEQVRRLINRDVEQIH